MLRLVRRVAPARIAQSSRRTVLAWRLRRCATGAERDHAVTRLAQVEASVAQIATTTGRGLRDVHAILDALYFNRNPRMTEEAIRKLETRTRIPDRASDGHEIFER